MDDELPEIAEQQPAEILDITKVTPQEHRHDRIEGNQLICTMHGGGCPSMTIRPTQTLMEKDGVLHLIETI